MGTNGFQGQIAALVYEGKKFPSGRNLFNDIKNASKFNQQTPTGKNCFLSRVGIQANPGDIVNINFVNDQNLIPIKIGKTGIYEIEDVRIQYLSFDADSDKNAIIDYIIKEV